MDGPYAVIKLIYSSYSRSNKNHCIKEMSYPAISAFCVGAVVMLLKNVIVEEKLMNGSIGKVIEIAYDNSNGPNIAGALPLYVVVNFPECSLNHSFIYGSPTTYISLSL